ncbi:hypothetical protein ACGF5M_02255 [Gemmatimonadota bacterium]
MTRRQVPSILLPALLAVVACSSPPPFPALFFGDPPDTEPVRLGPGIVSVEGETEMGCTFAPDASEFWFVRSVIQDDVEWPTLFVSRREPEGWSVPVPAPFDAETREFAPSISPDGKRFFFYRQKPSDPDFREGTWVAERTEEEWGEPRFFHEAYNIVQDLDGVLYFNTEHRESSSRDIATMRLEDGAFTEAEDLPGSANSDQFDAHPSVAPDGSFILFDSLRPDSLGGPGIHVTFRRPDGSWSPAQRLGDELSFDWGGNTPCLAPGGDYLLFHADADLWWVSAEVIYRWRPH